MQLYVCSAYTDDILVHIALKMPLQCGQTLTTETLKSE